MYETQKKRRIRRPAAWLLAVLLTGVLCCQAVWADQRTLIPVGKAVGIKLFADGVLVVSTSETAPCPARDCGIREGDLIVSCNGEKVTSTEDLQTKNISSIANLPSCNFSVSNIDNGMLIIQC